MGVDLATLLSQIFTGLVLGTIYVLLALGLSLIFGLLTVVNFSHGSLYMLGAYAGFFVLGLTKNFWLALVVAPLSLGAFGLMRGWLDAPATYHREPPPLDAPAVEQVTAIPGLSYERLTFESGYAPWEGEVGRERWLA